MKFGPFIVTVIILFTKKCKTDCPDEQSPDKSDQDFVRCYNCDGEEEWKNIQKRDLETARNYPHKIVTRSTGNTRCSVQQVNCCQYIVIFNKL